MLALESPSWSELRHAYGLASDTPGLLQQLASFPDESEVRSDPWFSLWSSLCHQGDVYSASFAAVPHIIATVSADPGRATMSFFLLPASIELARHQRQMVVPENLAPAYAAAMAQLPVLAGQAARPEWEPAVCASAMAAVAVATGNHLLAQLIMQIEETDIPEVLEWLENR